MTTPTRLPEKRRKPAGTVGLLHFTDFHQGMGGQKVLWPTVKERFFEDLNRLHDLSGPWDAILFTGDLTQRGTRAEFEAFDEWLNALTERVRALGSEPIVLAVPGNHDLQRPSESKILGALAQWHSDASQVEAFFAGSTTEARQMVNTAFSEYARWWHARAESNGIAIRHGLLPGDFGMTLVKDGFRLAVVGLSSSFLQLRDNMREGDLDVDPRQLTAIHEDVPEWLKGHHAALLLTHHPVNWLHSRSQSRFREEIDPPGRFVAHLFGHMHEGAARVVSEGGAKARRAFQGLSLFGLEWLQSASGVLVNRLHGYAGMQISVSGHSGEIKLWPRSLELNRSAEYRRMVPDHGRYDLIDEAVTFNFVAPLEFSSAREQTGQSTETPEPNRAETLFSVVDYFRLATRALARRPGILGGLLVAIVATLVVSSWPLGENSRVSPVMGDAQLRARAFSPHAKYARVRQIPCAEPCLPKVERTVHFRIDTSFEDAEISSRRNSFLSGCSSMQGSSVIPIDKTNDLTAEVSFRKPGGANLKGLSPFSPSFALEAVARLNFYETGKKETEGWKYAENFYLRARDTTGREIGIKCKIGQSQGDYFLGTTFGDIDTSFDAGAVESLDVVVPLPHETTLSPLKVFDFSVDGIVRGRNGQASCIGVSPAQTRFPVSR